MLVVKKKYGKEANQCLPYDYVRFTENGCTLLERVKHPTLVGILETTGTRYGFTKTHNSIYLCKPLDESYPPFYVGSKIIDRLRNKLITFSFDHWNSPEALPRGIFLSLLGDCGSIEAEKKACLLKASPWTWNTKGVSEIVEPSWERERIHGAFTIDPVGCKDADDCISFMKDGIAISIADVSAYVEVNPWMKFAEYIGTSLYDTGCVKPMFPPILSEDKFSLVEGKDRLTYTLFITFKDEKVYHEWKETIVNVKAYNYESIYDSNLIPILKEFVFRLSGINSDDSHKWVEALMLYYNVKAAEKAAILRKQSGKDLERERLLSCLSESYLSYESAKYCLPSDEGIHSQLGVRYAHASSPIRRYVDIINQFALKGKPFEYGCLERFNKQQKAAKSFERELIFIDLFYTKRILEGIVLDGENVFIPSLKKIIPYKSTKEVKSTVSIKYYTNPQSNKWKEKIIFQVE